MTRKLLLGTALCAAIAAACNSTGVATTAPTTAATAAPAATQAATTAPATSGPATSASATFEPQTGTTAVQGTATLTAADGKTTVVINVTSSGTETMAAAIQAGTCDALTPEMAYRLTEVDGGTSTTTVDVDLATLLASPYAINIFVMGSETESSITCGEITAS